MCKYGDYFLYLDIEQDEGVKNVIGLKRPAPYEIDLQTSEWFINLVTKFNSSKLDFYVYLDI